MQLPNLLEAKKRSKKPVEYIYESKKVTKVLDGNRFGLLNLPGSFMSIYFLNKSEKNYFYY